MYLWKWLIHNTVSEEWWAYRLVLWYCEHRGIDMPAGRCHFGEIAGLYAPIYAILGAVFVLARKVIWPLLKWFSVPLRVPAVAFGRRVDDDWVYSRTHPGLVFSMAMMVAVFWLGYNAALKAVGQPIINNGIVVILLALLQVVVWFIAIYLAIWTYRSDRVQHLVAIGNEAAEALHRPSVKRAGSIGAAPFKLLPLGFSLLAGFSVFLGGRAKSGWRNTLCPRLTYIDKDGNPFSHVKTELLEAGEV